MRKFSYFLLCIGGALSAALFFVRRTRWFALEQAQTMSEPAEFVEAGFWASLILLLIGVVLFARSFRRARREADEIVSPTPLEPQPWVCPGCGNANRGDEPSCPVCGARRGGVRREWVCPACGNVMPADAEECEVCGWRQQAAGNRGTL